jgi:hypothetical protein
VSVCSWVPWYVPTFDAAIHVCELAKSFGLIDGTKGGYDQRIERIRKKQRAG